MADHAPDFFAPLIVADKLLPGTMPRQELFLLFWQRCFIRYLFAENIVGETILFHIRVIPPVHPESRK